MPKNTLLTKNQIKQLKTLAHRLKPVVIIGQHGIRNSIHEEIEKALDYHQLIKVKVGAGEREIREQTIAGICLTHKAKLIQRVGNIAILYRRNQDKPRLA